MAWLIRILGSWGLWFAGAISIVIVVAAKQIWDGLLGVVDFVLSHIPAGFLSALPTLPSLPANILCILETLGIFHWTAAIATAILIRIPISLVFRG